MMPRRLFSILLVSSLFLLIISPAAAQSYYFELPKLTIDAYWQSDGSLSLDYTYNFVNMPSGHTIEYVDLGLPNSNYSDSNITASVDGHPVYDISSSGFQGEGSDGVAVGLGQYSIPPGGSGMVQIHVEKIMGVLYTDSQDNQYASAVFYPAYFQSSIITGNTDLTLTYHLPPEVQPNQPKWHSSPSGFPSQPATGFDADGRITYTWENKNANGYTVYEFGASFPKSYVPSSAIVTVNPFAGIGKFLSAAILPILCIGGFIAIVVSGVASDSRRKRQYLPPKISIEGHGIKRGLTAVEAAILLEESLDKIMTMILFSVIKKNAAEVITRDPLEIKVYQPIPEDLQPYEKDFLVAFQKTGSDRKKELRDMVVVLVKGVSEKMKGFSRRETLAYYRDITRRAWEQVTAADTPEVKSQKYEEVMEWTMLDRDYGDKTQDVFRNMPVFVPIWWGHYDPGFGRSTVSTGGAPLATGAAPRLPGADFAASLANGVQTFSSKVVGNINDFTSSITSVTNPPPKVSTTTSSKGGSGGGGHSCVCACACACAGCACACAGGGR
ncbi:MAG: hypothetical protein ACM3H7_01665 [Acidobacteriaceae bacterium]